jgi:hypothetical protein
MSGRKKMRRKLTLVSIFVAALIISMSFLSVVGRQSVQANEQESSSPLFAIRTQHATQIKSQGITTTFIGKEQPLNIFPAHTQNEITIRNAIQIFSANPTLFNKLLNKLNHFPYITKMLAKYGINTVDITNYLRVIQNNPSLLLEESSELQKVLNPDTTDPYHPLGLSTSNALACFIMGVFVLLPLTAFLTLLSLVFTLRILTCLNVNDCGNTIVEHIWNQLLQGLAPG